MELRTVPSVTDGNLLPKFMGLTYVGEKRWLPYFCPAIFIRKHYESIYEEAFSAMFLEGRGPKNSCLITGVPGIGKSTFLFYFMHRYLNDSRAPTDSLLLEFQRGEYLLVRRSTNQISFQMSNESLTALQMSDHSSAAPTQVEDSAAVAFFYDMIGYRPTNPIDEGANVVLTDLREQVLPHGYPGHNFIFSSPDERRYKEAIERDQLQFTMPTWSEDELKVIFGAGDGATEPAWNEPFKLFGGVPRTIANFLRDPKLTINLLLNKIAEKGMSIVNARVEGGNAMAFSAHDNYMLMFINPKMVNGTFMYRGPGRRNWASEQMRRLLLEVKEFVLLHRASKTFKRFESAFEDVYDPALAGEYFERILLTLIPFTGQLLLTYKLTAERVDDTSAPCELRIASVRRIFSNSADSSTPAVAPLPDILYVPESSSFAAVDCFQLDSLPVTAGEVQKYRLVLMQITVGEKHPISHDGVCKIWALFEQFHTDIEDCMFVFITPRSNSMSTKQVFVNKDGSKRQTPHTSVSRFIQYICRYEVVAPENYATQELTGMLSRTTLAIPTDEEEATELQES